MPERVAGGLPSRLSRFNCPYTVRVSASLPAGNHGEIDLHFVNYNRVEVAPASDGKPSLGAGIEDEKPVAVSGIVADFVLPERTTLRSVRFLTPEKPEARPLDSSVRDGRVRIDVPEFLVYAVVRIELHSAP